MITLLGTNITDKIYNTAISRQYTPEAAAAIAATISLEVSGITLISYRGDRYRKYADYSERKNSNPQLPDTQIAFIFDNLSSLISRSCFFLTKSISIKIGFIF